MLSDEQDRTTRRLPLVMERPCCLSCTRLVHHMGGLDEDEEGFSEVLATKPLCPYIGAWPGHDLMYGMAQCEGYSPRPSWDYVSPEDSLVMDSGAVIAPPADRSQIRRPGRETREIVIIIPPEDLTAFIVAPPPGYGKPVVGGGKDAGRAVASVADDQAMPMGDGSDRQSGRAVGA